MVRSNGQTRGIIAAVLAVVLAACAAASPTLTQTPAPTGGQPSVEPSGQPTTSTGPGSTDPAATPAPTEPGASPNPSQEEPLPEPTLTDGAEIAEALFDLPRIAHGVVSLVAAMGVTVYDASGGVMRPGSDKGAGELALTEDEVRGLIEMTHDDLHEQDERGGPVPIADTYAALQPSLPAGYSFEEFVAAYADAYSADPGALAAQVMHGRAITADTGLLRIQEWLLLIDGFIGPREVAVGRVAANSGHLIALPPGATLGAARQNLPILTSPTPTLSNAEWAELLTRLPTLAKGVPFEVVSSPTDFHEGHGGPGTPGSFFAVIGNPIPLQSISGRTLLAARPEPGMPIRWVSVDEATWLAHGAFDKPLGQPQLIDPGSLSAASVTFTPKKEVANGAGDELNEFGDLYARADAAELLSHTYDTSFLGPALFLARGRVTAEGPSSYPIRWHEPGDGYFIIINWTDVFDGIPDTINFRGLANRRDTSVQGVDAYYTGTGTATGSRPGWKSCNPGIDLVPSGSGAAEFQAGVQNGYVTVAAFPSLNNPLAGIFAGPIILPVDDLYKEFSTPAQPGALCPHAQYGEAYLIAFGAATGH